MTEESVTQFGKFAKLWVKWATLISILFFSEYADTALLDQYNSDKSLQGIFILIILFLVFSGSLAFMTLFYPTVERALNSTSGE